MALKLKALNSGHNQWWEANVLTTAPPILPVQYHCTENIIQNNITSASPIGLLRVLALDAFVEKKNILIKTYHIPKLWLYLVAIITFGNDVWILIQHIISIRWIIKIQQIYWFASVAVRFLFQLILVSNSLEYTVTSKILGKWKLTEIRNQPQQMHKS